MAQILSCSGLGKSVRTAEGRLDILSQISITVEAGASLAVTGVSGSGKSTLLGLLAGLDTPTEGEVFLAGRPLHQLDEEARAAVRARYVGFVFQTFQLLPGLSALENVMLPLELAAADGEGLTADPRKQAADYLDKVGLTPRLSHHPRQLSGGEQQRVAIARAFASRPQILFADEPTGNLDRASAGRVADLLFQLNAGEGATLILVTHDAALAARCDRSIALAGGRLQS
ncbi:MAG: ATP-binding cassette domain-containing protein [Gammaproteobacteria bacterium]|nr:ATP-binding cassette domain-containing protein [Gammaproteobacteria bacterium]MDD9799830.1 ATP-binding cassette domain-containing protein [Gammaproteobacteria bacterium]MDD9814461.1 ATP-binding cassette domain-containing protein [Gammaproteobacteria bacterium]MDD9871455.1 ATP-binding cassette domain-containing protein [Gammaproteobacteria bacterium]